MLAQKYSLRTIALLTICYSFFGILGSCKTDSNNKIVDVSKVKINTKFIRYDLELFSCDTNNIKNGIEKIGTKYPDFTSVFLNDVTGFGATNNPLVLENSLHEFISNKYHRGMMDTVNARFPNTKKIDNEITDMLKHVKYYYPNHSIGDVYYFVSGLNRWSAITVDSILGVGLDMYLGKQYPYYQSVQIPQYQINRCEPENISINLTKAIYEDKFPLDPNNKTLLELMISKGKELLFSEYILPEVSEAQLIGYTPQQFKWCQENEAMIWHYFVQQKLLYSTQWQEMMRYINDGPNSTGMPPESPGNIGSWVGWQLVKSYAKNNSNVDWKQILDDKSDGQRFLRESKYKPQ